MNLLRLRGTTQRHDVVDDADGTLAGFHTEHWDDHVDANVLARVSVPAEGLYMPGYGVLYDIREREVEYVTNRHGRRVPVQAGSAFASSGMYVANFIDVLDNTQLAIDTSLTTHKWALYTSTLTPNFSSDSVYSATNESTNASGSGYTAGGQIIVGPTTTESPTGTLMYDMNDQVWAAPTSTTARGGILYADALSDKLIVAQTYVTDFTSTAGTFTIQFAALGVFTIDLTP